MSAEPTTAAPAEDPDESTELAIPERLPPMSLPENTPEEFRLSLEAMRDKREALYAYIRSQLVKGTDYDMVGQSRKNTLLKPGGEKITSCLQLRAVFEKDIETIEMLGDEATGVIAYVCKLVTTDGTVVGEGRGACEPNERPIVNVRLKIALKRAQIDAVLRVAALSDHFTQDLEDGSPPPAPASRAAAPPSRRAAPTTAPRAPSTSRPPAGASGSAEQTGRPPRRGAAPTTLPHADLPDLGLEWLVPRPVPEWAGQDRDGNALTIVGVMHDRDDVAPTAGRRGAYFAPSDKAKHTREAPWTTWDGMLWGTIARWALKHRLAREPGGENAGEDTTRFNDPLLAILNDSFTCFYQQRATKLAEMACAVNGLVWQAVELVLEEQA